MLDRFMIRFHVKERVDEIHISSFMLRKRLTTMLREHPSLQNHPAVTVTWRDADTLASGVEVNKDYLEKQRVRWWSEDSLRKVMRNHGVTEESCFRAYFMPILKMTLDHVHML